MSEHRIPDQTIIVKLPRKNGKILHGTLPKKKYELFGAYQFSAEFNRAERNFSPSPPVRNIERTEWYGEMFRLRIDGKWHCPGGAKYEFFTGDQVAKLLLEKRGIE